ncbi:MAG: 1-deoxy-D-xylulose-5-phosphate reductoisomerase [Candidatus Omnitrophica bacterium]|nr:1-deoxy-D-xylulose-5-phosphate reductoisomerase [Candidatus Omnitrophota bacterium]
MRPKNVVILGSTGSIGINTLKVIERLPDKFNVVGLTAYNNFRLLERQIRKYSPSHVAVSAKGVSYLKRHVSTLRTRILNVEEGLERIVTLKSVDIVVIAMRGSAALNPFLSAVRAGKTIAPANKEALVMAGDIIIKEARRYQAKIIPIDSEQSAIFQCLEGRKRIDLRKIILTASGGVLLNVSKSRFDCLTVRQILNHPRWKMGKKITVDSATLMNKGFEIIEAKVLFRLSMDQIQVVIHPEAIIHSMAEFNDGSIIAQLSVTDMRLPIQYALTYPERLGPGLRSVNFIELGQFHFMKPDVNKFPSLALAIYAGRCGGTLPSVLNAADEVAVEAFLNHRIKFSDIYRIAERVVYRHKAVKDPLLRQIWQADQWARRETEQLILQ